MHTRVRSGHSRQPWLNAGHLLQPPPGLDLVVRRCTTTSPHGPLHPCPPAPPLPRLHTIPSGSAKARGLEAFSGLPAHEQLLWKELPRNQTQSLLSSQTLQVPEKQRKMRASHRQPASGKGTLSRIFQREATCPKK